MYLHPKTNLLVKKVTIAGDDFSNSTLALIDTGADQLFFHEKWKRKLKKYIKSETAVKVVNHGESYLVKIFIIDKHVYLDGNDLYGMQVIFYPKEQFSELYCTIIIGTLYMQEYLNKLEF
jgi:hypothetical protein